MGGLEGPSQVGLTGCALPSPQGPWLSCPPAGVPFPKALAAAGRRPFWALAKTTPCQGPAGGLLRQPPAPPSLGSTSVPRYHFGL